MRRHAFPRWLIRCAQGTTCFLGGLPLVLPLTLAAPPTFGSTGETRPGSVATAAFAVPAHHLPDTAIRQVAASDIFTPQPIDQSVPTIAVPASQEAALPPAQAVPVPRATLGFVTVDIPASNGWTPVPLTAPAPLSASTPMPMALPPARLGQLTTTSEWQEPNPFPPGSAGVSLPPGVPSATGPGQAAHYPRGAPTAERRSFVDLTAAPCFAHAPDYSWIVGRVEYSSITREWRLRYASVDEVDRFGGRVALIENQHVSYLADGMYVQVRGHLVNPEETDNRPTFYRIEWYRVVDNPNEMQTPAAAPAANPASTDSPPQ